ncbi:hypothetical protein [Henriciella sp.]|uniref:hypothetical protein n=1 Tax=Henriciella sp. TaxID=1968823 RepID=UPI0026105879|nr:hypothetical protein [Henriciella sp.]
MKPVLASAGLAALALAVPYAIAQEAAAPTQETAQPQAAGQPSTTIVNALNGLHVIVLEDQQGGMASIRNEQGDDSLIAFLRPAAAEAARQEPAVSNMTPGTVPLLALLTAWDGPVMFEGGAEEVEQANALDESGEGFGAPVFFVTADGKETQIDTGNGPATPILLSYQDAQGMASNLKQQGFDAETIEIVPLEFGSVLQQLNATSNGGSYKVFTHPETVEMIQSAAAQADGAASQ